MVFPLTTPLYFTRSKIDAVNAVIGLVIHGQYRDFLQVRHTNMLHSNGFFPFID
jgi:hypothetical protein